MSDTARARLTGAIATLLVCAALAVGWLAVGAALTTSESDQSAVTRSGQRPALPLPIMTPYKDAASSFPDPNLVEPGKPLTYSIAGFDYSSDPFYNLVITDNLPISMTNPTCVPRPQYTCVIGNGKAVYTYLAPEGYLERDAATLGGALATTVPNHSGVENDASLSYTNQSGTIRDTVVVSNVTHAWIRPNVSLTISDGPAQVQRNQLITYTITLTNHETHPVDQVWFTAVLSSSELDYIGCDVGPYRGYGWGCYGSSYPPPGMISFFGDGYDSNGITLAPGESDQITMTARVKLDPPNGRTIDTPFELHAEQPIASYDVSNNIYVPPVPLMWLNNYNRYFQPVMPNMPISETFYIRNIGGQAAHSLTLTDTLPAELGNAACDGGQGSCNVADGAVYYHPPNPFPADASDAITLTASVAPTATAGLSFTNRLGAGYLDGGGHIYQSPEITTTYQVITESLLAIGQDDALRVVHPGQLLTYTLVLTNPGPYPSDNYMLDDFLSPNVAFSGCTPAHLPGVTECYYYPSDPYYNNPARVYFLGAVRPVISPGQAVTMSLSVRVAVTATNGMSIANQLRVSYTNLPAVTSVVDSDTVQTIAEPSCNEQLTDVPETYWAYRYINYLLCHQVVGGYPDHSFQPGANMTRAQFSRAIVRAFNLPLVTPPTPHFSDVPATYWAYRYIESAYAAGALSGYPDGSFQPNAAITRAQVAVIIQRSRHYAGVVPPYFNAFADLPGDNYAHDAVEILRQIGIISGGPCSGGNGRCYRPAAPITRAELSRVLHGAMLAYP